MKDVDRLRHYGETALLQEYEQMLRQMALLALAVTAIEAEIHTRGQRMQERAEQIKGKYK